MAPIFCSSLRATTIPGSARKHGRLWRRPIGATSLAYGDDPWTTAAADAFREMFETDCEVFFAFNGTAANSLALASLCQSYHSVICCQSSHVETDECGAPEFFSNGIQARGCRKHRWETDAGGAFSRSRPTARTFTTLSPAPSRSASPQKQAASTRWRNCVRFPLFARSMDCGCIWMERASRMPAPALAARPRS